MDKRGNYKNNIKNKIIHFLNYKYLKLIKEKANIVHDFFFKNWLITANRSI